MSLVCLLSLVHIWAEWAFQNYFFRQFIFTVCRSNTNIDCSIMYLYSQNYLDAHVSVEMLRESNIL
jgi:hypothetical protein